MMPHAMLWSTNDANASDGDHELEYGHELAKAIGSADDLALSEDGEAVHHAQLEDGRSINRVEVRRETLSDGSRVCTIVLVPAPRNDDGGA